MRTRRSENGCVARSVITRREFVRFGAATLATAAVPGAMSAFAHGAGAPRQAKLSPNAEQERLALKEKPLESLKPTLPRTEENFKATLRKINQVWKIREVQEQ